MSSCDDSDDGIIPCKRLRLSSVIHSESESSSDELSNSDVETDDDEELLMDKPSSSSRPIDSTSEEEASEDDEESESSEDEEEDTIAVHSGEESDGESVKRYDDEKASAIDQEMVKNDESSSGDEDSECCPICLSKLSSTKLPSKPDSGCNHMFCRECIIEWSKQVNTCPIDRQPFKIIIVYNRIGGNEIAREKCKQKVTSNETVEVEAAEQVILCERCGCGDRGEVLLLCDGCDLGYHMDCLVPSLFRVPRGRWFCPTCEASGLISDYLTQRPTWRSIEDTLPRTMQNIRIRATIQRTINQVSALVGSITRPRKRKRKTTTKRKTKKKSPTKKKSGTKTKRKSTSSTKKKTTTKKRKSTKGKKRKTSKKKAAKSKKSESSKIIGGNGNNEAIPDFQLFGNQNDLLFYGDDEDLYASTELPSTSGISSSSKVLSKSEAVKILKASSQKPVAKVAPILRHQEEEAAPSNLLGQILSRQNEFLKPKDPSDSIIEKKDDNNKPDTNLSSKNKKKTDNPALIKCSQKQGSLEKRVMDSKSAAELKQQVNDSKSEIRASDSKSTSQKGVNDSKSATKCRETESKSNPSESSKSEYLSKEKKQILMTKAEEKVKTFLKPFFARGIIDKDSYKMIMRKCVEKVYERSKLTPVLDEKIAKLVKEYVERSRTKS